MATRSMKPTKPIVGHLRRAVLLRDRHLLTDSRLLESFRASGDEAAFEILVKRHGPMVLGVCQRLIGNVQDAEDAFQAVFLVLAKKAASIARCDLVGNWLYGVACRTALQARGRLGRRRAREMQVKDMPQPTVSPDFDLHELHQVLDLELNKLSDRYRVPIVLCDLEGRSRKDVASQLKIPEGTLSSRLAKGRRLLARRLVRHGVALPAGALATALTQQAASAAVRTGLVSASVKAAALTAAGQSAGGLLSAQVLVLSQGVLKTMLLNKLKVISLVCLGFVFAGVGVGFGVPRLMAQPAALAATTGQPARPGESRRGAGDDLEPIDGSLLLNQQIQADLQLSKNQINKLQAVSQGVDSKNDAKNKEIQNIQKQIDELRKQIAELQRRIGDEDQEIGKIRENIEGERKQALGKAAPEILSARAIKRLREIQRQRRGLRALLQDPKVQQMLKVDDEQVRKIEGILKKEAEEPNAAWRDVIVGNVDGAIVVDYDHDGWPDVFITGQHGRWDSIIDPRWGQAKRQWQPFWFVGDGTFSTVGRPARVSSATNRLLMDVLTDAQKKTLLQWVGEPYHSPSWQELWDKNAKARP
jgi:RNA polymerase sigma factor (sigma-70 family)